MSGAAGPDQERSSVNDFQFATVYRGSVQVVGRALQQSRYIGQAESGSIDILVNNVGVVLHGGLEELSVDDWDRAFALNTRSAFLALKHVLPLMSKAGLSVLRDALREDGAGQVMVIDGAEVGWRALFGDRMAAIAELASWEGVVINGLIRDSAEINAMHIGVKALGTAPRRAPLAGEGERDVDVCFGGTTIKPGQRIVADEDGVVVLPLGLLEHDIDIESAAAATGRYAAGHQ